LSFRNSFNAPPDFQAGLLFVPIISANWVREIKTCFLDLLAIASVNAHESGTIFLMIAK